MTVRVRRLGVLLVTFTLAITFVGSASAATAFSAPVKVTSTGCGGSLVVWTNGTARGFTNCRSAAHSYYVEGDGTKAFVRRTLHGPKRQLLAVADDGTATYLLYVSGDGLGVLTRTRSGQVTDQVIAGLEAGGGYQGTLVASHGRWWAVWTEPEVRGAWQAHTMGTPSRAQRIFTKIQRPMNYPSLALASGSSVALSWSGGHSSGCDTVEWARSSGANSWIRSPSIGSCGVHAVLMDVGGVWRIAWSQQPSGRVILADHASGRWVKRTLSTDETVSAGGVLSLDVRGKTVAVGWTTKVDGASRGVVDVFRSGRWTRTLLDTHIRSDVANESVHAVGLSGPNGGHTKVLLTDNDTSDHYDVVRRQ